MKRVLLYIGIALAAIGCTKSEITESVPTSGEIQFSAGVATRVSATDDCAWATDGSDKVGLLTDQAEDSQNIEFSVDKDGNMSSDSKLYPLKGENERTYYAYHPYTTLSDHASAVIANTIAIDHTADGSEPTTPLLWANKTSNENEVIFEFTHKLAKVTFNLTADGVDDSNLTGAEATLMGANAKATFSIESGTFAAGATTDDIPLTIENNKISAYLIPTESVKDNVKLKIVAHDRTFITPITTSSWVGGSEYEYNVTVGSRE